MPVRRKEIRRLVASLMAQARIHEPPVPVERVARLLGVQIRRTPADQELSGFILRDTGGQPPVIGVNKTHHRNRQRFTIAHEIGHFLLHEGRPLVIDRDRSFRVDLRDRRSSGGTDTIEKEANLFAAELLMPDRFLARDIAKAGGIDLTVDDELEDWANRYGVSPQALGFRLSYLGYVHA